MIRRVLTVWRTVTYGCSGDTRLVSAHTSDVRGHDNSRQDIPRGSKLLTTQAGGSAVGSWVDWDKRQAPIRPCDREAVQRAIGGWSLQKISVGLPTIWPAGPKSRLFGHASRAGGWRRHRGFRRCHSPGCLTRANYHLRSMGSCFAGEPRHFRRGRRQGRSPESGRHWLRRSVLKATRTATVRCRPMR